MTTGPQSGWGHRRPSVFLGGSRAVTRLDPEVAQRLRDIIGGEQVALVGDANGVDKAVQRFFAEQEPPYRRVEVFCSGPECRNNVGHWPERHIDPGRARGFAFYAAKDEAMAREADVALMIWDSKSSGSLKNVERMAGQGKTTVVFIGPKRKFVDVKGEAGWLKFLADQPADVRLRLQRKAGPTASIPRQPGLF